MKKLTVLLIAAVMLLSVVGVHAAETEKIWGDANGDGTVTVLDVTAIQKHLVELETMEDEKIAIVTGSDELSIADATLIQYFIAGLIDHFPVEESDELKMRINGTSVTVQWEDNEAVAALKEAVKDKPLTVQMSMYGGFEQVGSLGMSLPRNDTRITTSPGDVILYSGNQVVVFYGSNTWAYTRLGHITDKTPAELTQLLSNGNVTITLTY